MKYVALMLTALAISGCASAGLTPVPKGYINSKDFNSPMNWSQPDHDAFIKSLREG
jgi:hypothetical protein